MAPQNMDAIATMWEHVQSTLHQMTTLCRYFEEEHLLERARWVDEASGDAQKVAVAQPVIGEPK